MENESQRLYRAKARALGELGAILARADLPLVEVRLPSSLAEQAVSAWESGSDAPIDERETYEQRVQRHRAGTLGLIGLSITECGRWHDDEVVVDLSPDLIGVAVDAADDLPMS